MILAKSRCGLLALVYYPGLGHEIVIQWFALENDASELGAGDVDVFDLSRQGQVFGLDEGRHLLLHENVHLGVDGNVVPIQGVFGVFGLEFFLSLGSQVDQFPTKIVCFSMALPS